MKLLMIGGTGCLSTEVAKVASSKGFEITMINRGNKKPAVDAEVLVSDHHDYGKISNLLEGRYFDCVIDFLCYAETEVANSFSLYSRFCKQYIFISSCAVYDTSIGGVMKEDSSQGLEIWGYSIDKSCCEKRLLSLAEKSPCICTIVRPSVTYGDTRIPYGISPTYGKHWTLAARILAGKPIIRWNEGVNRCNMMRTEEFAVGVVGLIGNEKAYGEAFNICGDETPSFNDVISAMEVAVGKKAEIVDVSKEFYADEIPWRKGEILGGRSIDAINDNSKIKKAVPEFKQTVFLREGVAKTIKAYRDLNYQDGIDWGFDAQADRIAEKWCKLQGVTSRKYKLGFVDYLGTATMRDRFAYLQIRYSDRIWLRGLNFIARIDRKFKSLANKIGRR